MMDPEIARFVAESERFYPPDAAQLGIWDQRRLYDAYARAFGVRRPHGTMSEDASLTAAERKIPLRLYRPAHQSVEGTIVYAHGGGFVVGSLESHDGIVARVADETGCSVIAVDYRLAPEHTSPAALEDVLEVATAVLEKRSPWPELPRRIALVGDSAGGTLVCATALRLGRLWPDHLRALALIYPMLGYEPAAPACSEWANAPMLTLEDVRFYRRAYLGRDGGPGDVPLGADDLSDLPPTVLLPAEIDPLRDDCTVLANRLEALGIVVDLLPGTGLVHGALRALDRAPAMAEPFARMCAFVAKHLGRSTWSPDQRPSLAR